MRRTEWDFEFTRYWSIREELFCPRSVLNTVLQREVQRDLIEFEKTILSLLKFNFCAACLHISSLKTIDSELLRNTEAGVPKWRGVDDKLSEAGNCRVPSVSISFPRFVWQFTLAIEKCNTECRRRSAEGRICKMEQMMGQKHSALIVIFISLTSSSLHRVTAEAH